MWLAIIFWVCAAAVVYAYAGYPLLIWVLSRLFGQAPQPPAVPEGEWPTASLLIAAFNEESVIGERLENALATDYPHGQFQVVVASDGSSDATAEIVRRYEDRGVRLLDYKARQGKATVLTAAMAAIDSELVLLSDANTAVRPDATKNLARWFADPAVGAVCGRLVLVDPATGSNADGLYWRYETFLKKCEGRLGALLGSNGAIYAIRRRDYVPIPGNTIVDDFVLPLLIRLKTGRRIVYDERAVATEETPAEIGAEFGRRARIGAGGFQAIPLLWKLLLPAQGWTAFAFISHKILRWLCPLFLLGMLGTSLLLWRVPLFRALLGAHIGFYVVALVANYLPRKVSWVKPLRLATMFTAMNVALLVGLLRWLLGTQKGTWNRTSRHAEAPPPG
jgi:cellulose synthase/poly-beta-1,6-N-acetylglucosamine synthase-like glycosyltransferase